MTRIVIFAKAPVPGHAKTRLIPALGAEGAAALARIVDTRLLLGWSGLGESQIPDPYTQDMAAFEHAWELVDGAAEAIVERLKAEAA